MKIEESVLAVKTFFLEILGFLIPGYFFIYLFMSCLSNDVQKNLNDLLKGEYKVYVILILAYICGYFIYGIFEFKKQFLNKLNLLTELVSFSTKKIEVMVQNQIQNSHDYIISYKLLINHLGVNESDLPNSDYRVIRNSMMSYLPEIDYKIYTFMFRADLCKSIATSLQLIGFMGLTSVLLEGFAWIQFQNDYYFIILYLSFFLIAYIFNLTYGRFYSIAMRIIFPIFIAKFKPV
jgi:hypothetical protein